MPLKVSGLLSCAHPHTSYTNPFSRSGPDALHGFLPSWWWDARDDEVKETENRDVRGKRAKDSLTRPLNHSHIYNTITCVKSHNESAARHKRNNWLVVMIKTFFSRPLLTLSDRKKRKFSHGAISGAIMSSSSENSAELNWKRAKMGTRDTVDINSIQTLHSSHLFTLYHVTLTPSAGKPQLCLPRHVSVIFPSRVDSDGLSLKRSWPQNELCISWKKKGSLSEGILLVKSILYLASLARAHTVGGMF